MSQLKTNRLYFIDLIKILSVLAIFITHYLMDIGIINNMFNVDILYSFINRPNIHLGMLGCSLFIISSGYGLSVYCEKKYDGKLNKEEIFAFYKSRLTRVLIPFYFAYIIYFIIKVINQKTIFMFGGVPKWRLIFTILGVDEYVSANGIRTFTIGIGEWYLGCLILCYFIFPLLYYLIKKIPKLSFCLMTIYFAITPYFIDKFTIVPHMNFLVQIYNFYLGMLLFHTGLLFKKSKWMFFVSLLIFIFVYLYLPKINIYYIFICTTCSIAIFIIFSFLEENLKNNNVMTSFINIFNKYSYEFFLCHHFVIYQVNFMLNYRTINRITFIILFVIDFILTLLFSFSIHTLSTKIYTKRVIK